MTSCNDPQCPICNRQARQNPRPREDAGRFDQQLRLLGPDNQPAYALFYSITLADGSRHAGFTDRQGKTRRISSQRRLAMESITLQPPGAAWGRECCGGKMANEKLILKLAGENLATNDTDVGTSIATLKLPEGQKRRLTEGEIAMARTVFGDAVDYEKVWIHSHGWWLFLGFQDKRTAVTPNGEMYVPRAIYMDDFSAGKPDDRGKALFMHEMVHIWQYQMDYWIKLHAMWVTIRGASAYAYNLTAASQLSDFNMEQQGNIVSDYYMICVLQNPDDAYNRDKDPELLRAVMTPFLSNPLDKRLLPR